jgi:hypothetical protein
MILFRISPSGREEIATVLLRSEMGEAFVKLENGTTRWIPADWITDEED